MGIISTFPGPLMVELTGGTIFLSPSLAHCFQFKAESNPDPEQSQESMEASSSVYSLTSPQAQQLHDMVFACDSYLSG